MISPYRLLLFVHISGVAFWLGATLYAQITGHRAGRRSDRAELRRAFEEVNSTDHIFLPVVAVVLGTGIGMVVLGPWSFSERFIVIGLSGFGFTVLYGFGFLQPQVNRARALIERDGGLGADGEAVVRRFFIYWRIESIVLLAVVFAMVIKPRDGVLLTSLVAGALLSSAYQIWRAGTIRAAGRPLVNDAADDSPTRPS